MGGGGSDCGGERGGGGVCGEGSAVVGKVQTPSSKLQRSLKLQTPELAADSAQRYLELGARGLVFGASLELGAWSLELNCRVWLV